MEVHCWYSMKEKADKCRCEAEFFRRGNLPIQGGDCFVSLGLDVGVSTKDLLAMTACYFHGAVIST